MHDRVCPPRRMRFSFESRCRLVSLIVEGMSPQGRLFAPSEVTAMALFLCMPGSEGINGQALAITGGEA